MAVRLPAISLAVAAAISAASVAAHVAQDYDWWGAGEARSFAASADYPNSEGTLRTLLTGGPVNTRDHPFFTPTGPSGRACITCHQPASAMGLSVEAVQQRWAQTQGRDPLFASIDGSNCPTLPQASRESHSLLLDHGLIRIQRPWPPRNSQGSVVDTDFNIEVVRDPWGCNSGTRFGLTAESPNISVYRRPRPVANLKYLTAVGFAYDPKQGLPLPRDPETSEAISGNLMADGRAGTLHAQILDAAPTHLEFFEEMNREQRLRIIDFETRIFTAQYRHRVGGRLDDFGAEGGPDLLARSQPGQLGSIGRAVWSEFQAWENIPADAPISPEERAFKQSVARGARVFRERTFLITDSAGINSPIGFGNPVRNSCVFCHNMTLMGNDVAPGQVDLGTTNLPFADPAPHLPLFKITCRGQPHPHYGRTIYTHDPGFALTTGRCADVGKITLQSMRGLSARAPYFANGTAANLRAVVDYYDRRYRIGYSEQEKQDLVNLMSVL